MRKTRRRAEVLLLAALLFGVLGCGGAAPEAREGDDVAEAEAVAPSAPPRPAPPAAMAFLPAGTFGVFRADLEALRQCQYWGIVDGWLGRIDEALAEGGSRAEPLRGAVDAFRSTTLVLVGLAPGQDRGGEGVELILIARGRYETALLQPILRALLPGDDGKTPMRVERRQDARVLVGEGFSAAEVGRHTWLLATGGGVDAALVAGGPGGAGAGLSGPLREMADLVGFDQVPISGVVQMTPALREAIEDEMSEAAEVVSMGVRVAVQDGVDVEAIVQATNAAVVAALAQDVRRLLAEAAQQVGQQGMLGDVGLRQVLESAVVGVDGSRATLSAHVDDQTTRSTLELVGSFIGLFVALSGIGDGPGPAVPGGTLPPLPVPP